MTDLQIYMAGLRGQVFDEAMVVDNPDIERIIDTANWDDVPGIGHIDGGAMTSYHVSDNPEAALHTLKKKRNVVKAYGPKGARAELGPGFYMSGRPEFWIGRSRDKWSFMRSLTKVQLADLASSLRKEVQDQYAAGRISDSEKGYGLRDIKNAVEYESPEQLFSLASQPFVIPFWKPEWLGPIGVKSGSEPRAIEVKFRGKLAWLKRNNVSSGLYRQLRRIGVIGAFTTASMGTNPEMVLWNPRAILSARIVKVRA